MNDDTADTSIIFSSKIPSKIPKKRRTVVLIIDEGEGLPLSSSPTGTTYGEQISYVPNLMEFPTYFLVTSKECISQQNSILG